MTALTFRSLFKPSMLLAAMTVVMFMASLAVPAQSEAATIAAWPRSFTLNYLWGTSDITQVVPYGTCAELTLHKRPKSVDVFDCASGTFYPDAGTWSKTGNWSQVTFDFGVVTYWGTKQPDGSYHGTMLTTNGMMGVWVGQF